MKKNILRIGLLLATAFALCACSGVKQIGKVGGTTFYSVSNARLFAPNYNALVVSSNDTVTVAQVIGGSPVSGQVIGAAIQGSAIVGGAYVLGHNFPKNVGDNITTSGGATSNQNASTASNSNNNNASNEATGGNGSFTPPGLVNNPGHTP